MAGTSDEEMIRLLTQGLDTVMVNVRYKNHTFQIPACRKNSNESYRISHRTLLYFYQKLRRECRDVKICMKPEWKKCEVNYSIAACTVVTQDGESDLYFGENKQTPISTGVNSNSPFQIAVNRAMDKAFFMKFLDYPADISITTETQSSLRISTMSRKEMNIQSLLPAHPSPYSMLYPSPHRGSSR